MTRQRSAPMEDHLETGRWQVSATLDAGGDLRLEILLDGEPHAQVRLAGRGAPSEREHREPGHAGARGHGRERKLGADMDL